MALGPRLDLRQSQSLVMTPQLQQAIQILALSNLEIETYVAGELERNPLLEIDNDNGDSGGDTGDANPPEEENLSASDETMTVDVAMQSGSAGQDASFNIDDNGDNFQQDSAADSIDWRDEVSGTYENNFLDAISAQEISLQDHLIAQAGERLSGTDLAIARQIIEQVEETGYFDGSLPDIAQRLNVPLPHVEKILDIIQGFDPAGIAARSLAECLMIQAKEADRYDPAMARLIDNLDYLAKANLTALKRICGVDDEDLSDMIQELRAYDPKPGYKFQQGERVDAITADVLVRRRGNGWAVELNSATLPRLLVNRRYYAEISSGIEDKKAKAWLSECLASANWLLKALDQRARTIVKVATEIVKQQDAFFRQGAVHLRPLTLRAVADAIGMHESTISRVTSNKYLACDRGLFELKYFFASAIQSADGKDAVSATAIKSHIQALIAAEEANNILSDDQLVDMLRAKGFDIARRTITKYREALGIGSSVQRRRQKAIGNHAA